MKKLIIILSLMILLPLLWRGAGSEATAQRVDQFDSLESFTQDMYLWILDPNSNPQSKRFTIWRQDQRYLRFVDTVTLVATQHQLNSGDFDKTGDWTGTFDGQEGTWYQDRANHTGTQDWNTITGTPTTIAGYGITDAQNLSIGTDNQVPFVNLAGDNFDYSSNFRFDGGQLDVDNININGSTVQNFTSGAMFVEQTEFDGPNVTLNSNGILFGDSLSIAGSISLNGTSALLLPAGTTAQRPSPSFALIRGNTTTGKLEGVEDGVYKELITGGPGATIGNNQIAYGDASGNIVSSGDFIVNTSSDPYISVGNVDVETFLSTSGVRVENLNSTDQANFAGQTAAGNDSGSTPVVRLNASNNGAASLATRPTLAGYNYLTKQWEVAANGNWDYQGSQNKNLGDPTDPQDAVTLSYFEAGGLIKDTTITVTSAQILALNTSPVTLIDAPGAGNFIVIEKILHTLDFNTTAYTFGGGPTDEIQPRYGSGGSLPTGNYTLKNMIESTDDFLQIESGADIGGLASNYTNKAIVLEADLEDPETGDSDIVIEIWYIIKSI